MPQRCLILLIAISSLTLAALEGTGSAIVAINPVTEGEQHSGGGSAIVLDAEKGVLLSLLEVLTEKQREGTETEIPVLLPGGKRCTATVSKRGASSTAILLQLAEPEQGLRVLPHANSDALRIGDSVWSCGNPFGGLTIDGEAVLSRGIVSGRYDIQEHAPNVRGRRGKVLSTYRGPVLETTAAINDGIQGGALVDDNGALVGICSLGVAHERRVGTAIPLARILSDLELPAAKQKPVSQSDPAAQALQDQALAVASGVALVYFERFNGLGNPKGVPRPQPIDESVPRYRHKQLQAQWDRYYHQQQVFYTDQAVPAIVIDAEKGLLLTAAENLHGDATSGFVIQGTNRIRFKVHGVHKYLDLACLQTEEPLTGTSLALNRQPDLHSGDPIAVIGRHRDGGAFTMTSGIVSATDRRVPFNNVAQSPFPLHQTDAAANYGNLGAPVIDTSGDVVGMVVRIGPTYSWKINSGIAIFIDSGTIASVWPDLADGKTTDGREIVGIGITTKWRKSGGCTVRSILPASQATEAGLKIGDRITGLNGHKLEEEQDLHRLLIRRQAGDVVELNVTRGEEHLTIPVELRLL